MSQCNRRSKKWFTTTVTFTSSAKRLSSQSSWANSGVCPFFSEIYTDFFSWGMTNKKSIKKLWPISCFLFLFFFFPFYCFSLFLLTLCQIPFGASTSTAAHKNPVKTPWCHYCNHSYRNSRPLAAGAAGRWAGTPSSVGCWSGGAWSQAG